MKIWPGICVKVVVDTAGIMGGVFAKKPPSHGQGSGVVVLQRQYFLGGRHWAVGPFRFL